MKESCFLDREAREIGGERANRPQLVEDEVHVARPRGAIGSARSALGIESKTRVRGAVSDADGAFGRDK